MRVLVTWGSRRGGTEGIARIVADVLTARGFEVAAAPARQAPVPRDFDAVVVGGALYANRWAGSARRFVARHVDALSRVPVWLFSSGPLDDSAGRDQIPPVREVAVLAGRIGAYGHQTFGGRLAHDAKGFPASAMAAKLSGDWRDPVRIRAWAEAVADALPTAKPRPAVEPAGRSWIRLLAYGAGAWAVTFAAGAGLSLMAGAGASIAARAVLAFAAGALLGRSYFSADGAREPLAAAALWTLVTVVLDVAVAAMGAGLGYPFATAAGTGLPAALLFMSCAAAGFVVLFTPAPAASAPAAHGRA